MSARANRLSGVYLDLSSEYMAPPSVPRGPAPLADSPALHELLATEKKYVEDLGHICDSYLAPLRSLGLIPKNEERALFSNVETLRGINQELLQSLLADNTLAGAAAAFERIAPYLKAYSQYCADYAQATESLERLAELRAREGWGSALEAVLQDGERQAGQPLSSLLIKPGAARPPTGARPTA